MTHQSEAYGPEHNDLHSIQQEILPQLHAWGSELIRSDRYEEPGDPYREMFALDPDNPSMHSRWHQWGIIRHQIIASFAFETIIPKLLVERVGATATANYLALDEETIDGADKWGLLGVAVSVHDFGKFTRRQYSETATGPAFGFGGHEAESGAIVRHWQERFYQLGLTPTQVEYVARCAELHFELGKLRELAKQSTHAYTVAFTATPLFETMSRSIAEAYPDYKREIGVLFLADNLAKTDVRVGLEATTDRSNEALFPLMEEIIKTRGLSPALLPAAKQVAVNAAAGARYLELALN